MSVENLICKTNPKTVNMDAIGGGISELTTSEISGYLHGTNDGAYYTGMAYYAGQDHSNEILKYLFKHDIPKIYQKYRMDDNERGRAKDQGEGGFLWSLAGLAVCEYIAPFCCLTCQGTKFVGDGVESKIKACPSCGGGGKAYLTPDQKANILEIEKKRWWYWEPFVESTINAISKYKCEATHHICNEIENEREINY